MRLSETYIKKMKDHVSVSDGGNWGQAKQTYNTFMQSCQLTVQKGIGGSWNPSISHLFFTVLVSLFCQKNLLFRSVTFSLFIKPHLKPNAERILICTVIVQFTKAVSHLLQYLLNCLNFEQEEDEAERKQDKKEMQDEKRPEFNCNKT